MNLLACQNTFIDQILHDDAPLPATWATDRTRAGLAIYRMGYRSRLIDAVAETFPRTRQWVGEQSFDKAAAHHLIAHPPSHWSLDHAGAGFPETLATLFAHDPEVPELAALEWDMHMAFVARDAQPLDGAPFAAATAGFADRDWDALRLTLNPSLTVRPVRTAAMAIWRALEEESQLPGELVLPETAQILIWRSRMSPVLRVAANYEADCLGLLRDDGTFGDLCLHLARVAQSDAATMAGGFLASWLRDGMIIGLR